MAAHRYSASAGGVVLFFILTIAPAICHPAESDTLNVTLGAKAWFNDWTTWRVNPVFSNVQQAVVHISEPLNSGSRFTITPQVSVRYGNFLASASYLVPETYSLTGALQSIAASRNELDANVGYYILPGVALTFGYKNVRQDYGPTFQWTGPTAGVAASAPLGSTNFAVYGLFGYGALKLKVPANSADDRGDTTFDATYKVTEFGVSYGFGLNRVLNAARVTLGYRAQTLTTRGYVLLGINPTPNENDFTQGVTLGLSGTF